MHRHQLCLNRSVLSTSLVAFALLAGCAAGGPGRAVVRPRDCAALNGMTIAAADVGLPTSGATVTSTQIVAAAGVGAAAVGEYCKVLGDIDPVDPNAPKIKFQLNLPAAWNGKAMMFGGGGYDGILVTGTANVPAGPVDKPTPVGRGYATFGSDSGHQPNATTNRDGSFGLNDEALHNFSGDALKKTRDTAIVLIKARYGVSPQRTYFAGGSTGGREALLAVGNWPQDFDGAIVLYPAWNATALNHHFGRLTQALAKPGAYPSRAQRKVLLEAALQVCDKLDGVADRLISNQLACNAQFDPATAMLNGKPIQCPSGQNNDTCLTGEMIAAVKVFEQPTLLFYRLPSGESGYPGFTVWGTDFGIPTTGLNPVQAALEATVLTLTFGTVQPAVPMPAVTTTSSPPFGSTFWDQWVKYFVTRDVNANPLTLSPVTPGQWQQRLVDLSAIQDVNRSDFSAFSAKGGKVLMAHGIHDGLVANKATQQFVARVRETMGSSAVANFMRYYEIPGYGHAVSSQFAAAWDSLTTLEDWVEKGVAPPPQIVADTAAVAGRTRPLCEYPAWPRYNGSGGVDVAASFTCVGQ